MNRTNWLNHINNPQLFENEDKNFNFTNDLMQKIGKATNKIQLLEHKNKQLQAKINKLNNIINELEKDIKNLYTYGIKNNAEQKNYLLNRLKELKEE